MVKFGAALPSGEKPQKLINYGEKTSNLKFDSIWNSDHLLYTSNEIKAPEAWSILTILGYNTDIQVGTSVSDPHRYHPVVLAQRLATITHITQQKIILGLGAGESMNLDPFKISWDKPVTRMAESIDIMKNLWRSNPQNPINYDGEYFGLNDAYLQIEPERDVKIYIGAMGKKTRKLAGKKGDGWIPCHIPPKLFRRYWKDIKSEVKKSDTKTQDFEKCIYIGSLISEDKTEAIEKLKPIRHIIAWPEQVRKAGYDLEIPENLKNISYSTVNPNNKEEIKNLQEIGKLYPEQVCLDFTISGNVDDCINKIEKYIESGVDHFILLNLNEDSEKWIEKYSEEIIPYFNNKFSGT